MAFVTPGYRTARPDTPIGVRHQFATSRRPILATLQRQLRKVCQLVRLCLGLMLAVLLAFAATGSSTLAAVAVLAAVAFLVLTAIGCHR